MTEDELARSELAPDEQRPDHGELLRGELREGVERAQRDLGVRGDVDAGFKNVLRRWREILLYSQIVLDMVRGQDFTYERYLPMRRRHGT